MPNPLNSILYSSTNNQINEDVLADNIETIIELLQHNNFLVKNLLIALVTLAAKRLPSEAIQPIFSSLNNEPLLTAITTLYEYLAGTSSASQGYAAFTNPSSTLSPDYQDAVISAIATKIIMDKIYDIEKNHIKIRDEKKGKGNSGKPKELANTHLSTTLSKIINDVIQLKKHQAQQTIQIRNDEVYARQIESDINGNTGRNSPNPNSIFNPAVPMPSAVSSSVQPGSDISGPVITICIKSENPETSTAFYAHLERNFTVSLIEEQRNINMHNYCYRFIESNNTNSAPADFFFFFADHGTTCTQINQLSPAPQSCYATNYRAEHCTLHNTQTNNEVNYRQALLQPSHADRMISHLFQQLIVLKSPQTEVRKFCAKLINHCTIS